MGKALLTALLAAAAITTHAAEGGRSRHQGEILGVDREARTFTVRNVTPEGKELILFHVDGETRIVRKPGGDQLEFEDLAAGQRVKVRSVRRERRRWAVTVEVKVPSRKGG